MFHRVGPAAYKSNLNNTLAISKYFKQPERKFKTIHIAGTNGKGSTAHIIASVLQEKGLKTGLCTSPHLKDFRERIKINGEMIDKDYVCSFINNNIEFINQIEPSFFELTIGMTFKYFADKKIDVAVIETGMGGRLDSTNIINPVVSVITNIGHDHTNLLGTTIEKIAVEKAGIIKPETPVVIGQTQKTISDVFIETAKNNNSPLFFADQNYSVDQLYENKNVVRDHYKYIVKNNTKTYHLEADLAGAYQAQNIAAALQCFEVLKSSKKINITEKQIEAGLRNVKKNTGLKGRWQILDEKPLTICDTGHNPEAINMIIQNIKNLSFDKLHFVIGIMNDKNVDDILMLLPKNATYYFTQAKTPRAMNADDLKSHAKQYKLSGQPFDSVDKAVSFAKRKAKKDDLIFIGGSTFIVAEAI